MYIIIVDLVHHIVSVTLDKDQVEEDLVYSTVVIEIETALYEINIKLKVEIDVFNDC